MSKVDDVFGKHRALSSWDDAGWCHAATGIEIPHLRLEVCGESSIATPSGMPTTRVTDRWAPARRVAATTTPTPDMAGQPWTVQRRQIGVSRVAAERLDRGVAV